MCSCVVVFMRRACPFQNLNVLVCAQRREPHHLQHCVANHLRFAAQHGPRLNEVWPDIRTRSKPRRFSFLFFCRRYFSQATFFFSISFSKRLLLLFTS